MATTYTLIASNTLSSNAASVTFSSIPGTYTDLVIRYSARNTGTGNAVDGSLEFNGDTATNYSDIGLYGTGASGVSFKDSTQSKTYLISHNGSGTTTNTFTDGEIYIPSYTASQNKQVSSSVALENNSTTAYRYGMAGLWRNTAAITSIVIGQNGTNFASGSSFYLYGIKNT